MPAFHCVSELLAGDCVIILLIIEVIRAEHVIDFYCNYFVVGRLWKRNRVWNAGLEFWREILLNDR